MTTPEKILEGAIEILERDGWCQGDYFEKFADDEIDDLNPEELTRLAKTAPVCSMGAIYRSAYGFAANVGTTECYAAWASRGMKDLAQQAEDLLNKAIAPGRGVIGWNDEDGRSKEEVILTFKKAANHDFE